MLAAIAVLSGCGSDQTTAQNPATASGQGAGGPQGFWFPTEDQGLQGAATNDPARWAHSSSSADPQSADLGAIGYASSYATESADWTGVRTHVADAALAEPFVFSSGHDSAAFVLQVDGTIERRWALDGHPDNAARAPRFVHETQRAWRRVVPLDDGGLLAIHEGLCMLRLDADSRILWRGVEGAHHDLLLPQTGTGEPLGLVLDRMPVRSSKLGFGMGTRADWIIDDGIAWFEITTGKTTGRVSILKLLRESQWDSVCGEAVNQAAPMDLGDGRLALDPLHANALLFDERTQSVLVLMRDVGAIVTVQLDRSQPGVARITEARFGPWQGAHDPQWSLSTTGSRSRETAARSLVLFDNHGSRARAMTGRPASRLLELAGTAAPAATSAPRAPQAQAIFEGSDAFPFHSSVCGSLDPLPGGGWLVTETTGGRAFQIDADGSVVWEFRSPFRDPDGLWVSALLDMRRLP